VTSHDPGGSGLALSAGLGSTFMPAGQRLHAEVRWLMSEAKDRIQAIAIRVGAIFP
jgi:hypothetical protein